MTNEMKIYLTSKLQNAALSEEIQKKIQEKLEQKFFYSESSLELEKFLDKAKIDSLITSFSGMTGSYENNKVAIKTSIRRLLGECVKESVDKTTKDAALRNLTNPNSPLRFGEAVCSYLSWIVANDPRFPKNMHFPMRAYKKVMDAAKKLFDVPGTSLPNPFDLAESIVTRMLEDNVRQVPLAIEQDFNKTERSQFWTGIIIPIPVLAMLLLKTSYLTSNKMTFDYDNPAEKAKMKNIIFKEFGVTLPVSVATKGIFGQKTPNVNNRNAIDQQSLPLLSGKIW